MKWRMTDGFSMHPRVRSPLPLSPLLDRNGEWETTFPCTPASCTSPPPSPLLDTGVEMCGFGAAGERYNPDDAALYSLSRPPSAHPPTVPCIPTLFAPVVSLVPPPCRSGRKGPVWGPLRGPLSRWHVTWLSRGNGQSVYQKWTSKHGNEKSGWECGPLGRGQGRRGGKCYHEPLTLKQPGSLVRQPAEGRCCCCVSLLLFLLFIAFIEAVESMLLSHLFTLTIW